MPHQTSNIEIETEAIRAAKIGAALYGAIRRVAALMMHVYKHHDSVPCGADGAQTGAALLRRCECPLRM